MAYLPKEKYGQKLLYHHSAGAIASVLLSFLVIGIYVATFFLPYQGFTELIGQPSAVTGLDFVMYVIKAFNGGTEQVQSLNDLTIFIRDNIFDGNGISTVVMNVYYYFMVLSLIFMGIYAFILLIGSLILLFKGSLKHWRLPASMAKRIFWHGLYFYGPICLLNLYNAFIKPNVIPGASGTIGSTFPCFFTYMFLGGLFILHIILIVIYHKCFKDHAYVKNEETLNRYIEEYERENLAVDLTEKEDIEKMEEESKKIKPAEEAPKKEEAKENILVELPKPVNEKPAAPVEKVNTNEASKHLPKGLKVIGGHAFSQNTLLEDADIPEGIDTLGSGAFANCVNLRRVHLPLSLKKIEYNCFFNCIRLEKITYAGTRENWRKIKRGSNWLTSSGTNIVNCSDGAIAVDRTK